MFIRSNDKEDTTVKKSFKIEVDCAACALKMEEAAKKTEGVKDASVNFMALKMNVEFEEGADVKSTMEKVLKNCRGRGREEHHGKGAEKLP